MSEFSLHKLNVRTRKVVAIGRSRSLKVPPNRQTFLPFSNRTAHEQRCNLDTRLQTRTKV